MSSPNSHWLVRPKAVGVTPPVHGIAAATQSASFRVQQRCSGSFQRGQESHPEQAVTSHRSDSMWPCRMRVSTI